MEKLCKQCGVSFHIYDEDVQFLKKMSTLDFFKSEVSLPTLCPECRQQRRMAFRNERNLYQRTCDVTGKKIISVYRPDCEQKVCDKDYFYSEKFDPFAFGKDFDFERPFFEQFKEMLRSIPLPSLRIERSENCDFNNDVSDDKNCYLCARTHKCSDMLYTYRGNTSTSCADCYQVKQSELLYECLECLGCYNCRYAYFSTSCTDCAFVFDCHGCKNCVMCTNLHNKQYCLKNEQLSKEEFEEALANFDFSSHGGVEEARVLLEAGIKRSIKRNLTIINSEDCSGDNIVNSKNCFMCFGAKSSRDGRYLWDVNEYNDSMDIYSGGRNSELIYEATSTTASNNCKFCVRVTNSHEVNYSMNCHNCSYLFGCVGLSGKKYCILNKQYSEDEYKEKIPKIISRMMENEEWGEFFPAHLSPFGYNETVAQEVFPMTKGEALEGGFNWSDYQAPRPQAAKYVKAAQLPDKIDDVGDVILEWAVECERSGRHFKIIPSELSFYRRLKIPIPHFSPDERYLRRYEKRNSLKLRIDKCAKCGDEMMTSYKIGTENVYCEKCYEKTFY